MGLHRLEAAKALSEKTIVSFLVDAPKHRRTGAVIRSRGHRPFKKGHAKTGGRRAGTSNRSTELARQDI